MHMSAICSVSSEIEGVFMNIKYSHEVELCPEGNEVEWGNVFMIVAWELWK